MWRTGRYRIVPLACGDDIIKFQKIRNYHGVVKFALWYLENKAPIEGATSNEIRNYLVENNLFLSGYRPSVSQIGHILGNSKKFRKKRRYSQKYGNAYNFWTVKK